MRPDSDTVEKTIKNIIKISSRNAKSHAEAKLQGVSTIKTWRYTMPQGQKFVGAVRAWKYSTLQAVESFNKPPASGKSPAGGEDGFHKFQKSSKPVNTMDDF